MNGINGLVDGIADVKDGGTCMVDGIIGTAVGITVLVNGNEWYTGHNLWNN